MIRRELAKDPKLANEPWDRFLPQFRKRHLKTSEKTTKKNERIDARVEARNQAGIPTTKEELQRKEAGADGKEKKQKKNIYTPFPPAQQPRKVDLQLETGEYFLKTTEKEKREEQKKRKKVRFRHGSLYSARFLTLRRFQQTEATEKRRQERAEVFVAPKEEAAPTVEEKRKKKRAAETSEGVDEGEKPKKKKRKKEKAQGDDQN